MKNPYTDRIIKRIEKQTDKGIHKYGANMQDNPLNLSLRQVLEYAAEENADQAVYIEKALEMIGEENHTEKYPVRGLLQCLVEESVSINEVEARINSYICAARIKAKGEAKLEVLNKAFKDGYKREKGNSSLL